MTVAGLGHFVHHFVVMTDYEKIMALPKPRKNNRKPFYTVIGGVKVQVHPHPLKGNLPMTRIRKVMREMLLEDMAREKKAAIRHA
jgi:hypothetical protein